ncbi:sensor histidine kinase [Pseudahrensia aquimaris]|uniref:Sensor histidine kinase n=2 Tax=Pseudahrensia aquimaris TaxID=744461 RepID=A0ABW3FFV0_9HYPH
MLADLHPENEQRLETLRSLAILDSGEEETFNDLLQLVAQICDVPIALISLVDEDRQWFKAKIGLDAAQTGLEMSVCSHTILQDDLFIVPDTDEDPRTADMPKETYGLDMRFYAGAKIMADDDMPVGSLCVIDNKPRVLSEMQKRALKVLGDQVGMQIRARKMLAEQEAALREEQERIVRQQKENEALQRLLADREMLTREVDHRVKNSLQLVMSMLRFQANATQNDEIQEALDAAQNRVRAIASVHAELDHSAEEGRINLASYATNLATDLNASTPSNVTVTTTLPPVVVDAKQATSLAIIFNEFVANSVKYAFPDDAEGMVAMVIAQRADKLTVTLTDNGIGYDASHESNSRKGLGIRIMDAAARQLGADLAFSNDTGGTEMSFEFTPA